MNLGIVGSRNFNNYLNFKNAILKILKIWNIEITDISKIISGGAKGADSMAEQFAKEYGISTIIFKPNWKQYGSAAGVMRNTDIVNCSDKIIAFPSKEGKGTQDTIKKARNKNIPIYILYID